MWNQLQCSGPGEVPCPLRAAPRLRWNRHSLITSVHTGWVPTLRQTLGIQQQTEHVPAPKGLTNGISKYTPEWHMRAPKELDDQEKCLPRKSIPCETWRKNQELSRWNNRWLQGWEDTARQSCRALHMEYCGQEPEGACPGKDQEGKCRCHQVLWVLRRHWRRITLDTWNCFLRCLA